MREADGPSNPVHQPEQAGAADAGALAGAELAPLADVPHRCFHRAGRVVGLGRVAEAGPAEQALRYTVSTLLAYGAFLGLLWLWMRTRPDDWADVADGVSSGVDVVDLASAALRSRGVGMQSVQAPHMDVAELPTTSDSSGGWNLGDVADADEFAVVVLIVVAVVALASAGMYIIVQAPSLLAEVALDGAVMGSLYQRLQQAERQHWALSAWAYTRWPLLGLLCVMALLGWGLQLAAPGALTMGQALAAFNS